MKWVYNIRYKIKAAMLLTGIIIIILLSNFFARQSFSNLDTSMSSIYNDRLKPASYLYEISHHLYQKRLLHDGNVPYTMRELELKISKHNQEINSLIKQYETTFLTEEEQQQWTAFINHFAEYNAIENEWLKNYNEDEKHANVSHTLIAQQFSKVIGNLNNLNKIQIGEGSNIQKKSHSIVNHTLLLSTLEISLLIVLSLFTLVILSTTDRIIFRNSKNQALN